MTTIDYQLLPTEPMDSLKSKNSCYLPDLGLYNTWLPTYTAPYDFPLNPGWFIGIFF